MKSEITYHINLKKHFEAGSNSRIGGELSSNISDASYDPFHNRVTPIETFVGRVSALVGNLNGSTHISSDRLIEKGTLPSKLLCINFGSQKFWISDQWQSEKPTAASTHRDNEAFLDSAEKGVVSFANAVADLWPSLTAPISDELVKLENRLRQNCHAIMRRAERKDKYAIAMAARNEAPSTPHTLSPLSPIPDGFVGYSGPNSLKSADVIDISLNKPKEP